MKRKMIAAAAVLLLTLPAMAAPPVLSGADRPVYTSGAADQVALEITAYNENLGLIKDQRKASLGKGVVELRFADVAAGIDPATVFMRSLTDPSRLSVLEQNYEYDLLNPRRLLDKYVGKEVKLYYKNYYTEREEFVTAKVLSNNDNNPVYQIGDEITFNHPGRIIFPSVPENLISKPTLVWLLDNGMSKVQTIETTYLTSGIGWRADYVFVLDEKDTSAGVTGWVTLDNKSGATYRDAALKLVAGDVHRVRAREIQRDMMFKGRMMEAAAAPQFREEAFFEYHLYTLERQTTLKDNSTKQITLLTAQQVPAHKEFRLYGADHYYRGRYGEPQQKQKVGVFLEIVNSKESGMGMPLPKGVVRVYKHDRDGSLQFTGEDTIDHTPRDEKIKLKLGEAFDVVAERKQTDWRKLASDTYEAAFEISVRNHKREDITVRIVEPVPGDWKVPDASHRWVKTSASQMEFTVPVGKDGETTVTYRVRMRF
ncbi:MAG: DUF4139 domain-containing protein [Deltaproteobacteria bacterium]|nr:DUF4139 domain-containing protein [Deltaproteobacteria bacterium]